MNSRSEDGHEDVRRIVYEMAVLPDRTRERAALAAREDSEAESGAAPHEPSGT